jgi:hypothetical protein
MTLDQILDITIVVVTVLIFLACLGAILWRPFLAWGERFYTRRIEARSDGHHPAGPGTLGHPPNCEHLSTPPGFCCRAGATAYPEPCPWQHSHKPEEKSCRLL